MENLSPHHAHHDHKHGDGRPRVTLLVNDEVSQLAPFSGIILTIALVVFFLVRYYVFENFLIPRIYGDIYKRLNDNQRRGFINHHVAATAKIVMIISGAYPFMSVLAGKASLHHHFAGSKVVTLGDVLLVLNQVFIAMYLFELIFRQKLSPVAVAHHIGSVIIAAVSVAISLEWQHQRDATIEFMLCYLWGMFDVLAEFWPHIAIILYRMRTHDHVFLCKVFFVAMCVTFAGTITETVVVMYFWGWAWDRWTTAFRIVTPILHVIFSAAQLWGAYNFYKMWQNQKRKLRGPEEKVERGESTEPVAPT
ncbi:hypothetical protein ACEQ8H_002273 [Pleosporales sp. CAS-2024a]